MYHPTADDWYAISQISALLTAFGGAAIKIGRDTRKLIWELHMLRFDMREVYRILGKDQPSEKLAELDKKD